MKSALSLTLIASLVGSAPVAAQDRMESTAGPIARAVTREAVRLAADPQSELAGSDWARVRSLVPGTEVIVTITGARLGKRYIVRADESELVVTVTERGHEETLARTNVVEISVPPVSRHPARIGALIGAGVGFGVALKSFGRACGDECDAVWIWPLFAGVGAGIGAGIGALIGASGDHMPYVIYRAP